MEKMVALANVVHGDLLVLPDDCARYDLVKQIIDSAEVVFAVWTDRFAQDGVGHMLVKGQAIARQAVADNKMAVSTRVAAIPCNTQSRLRHCCMNLVNGIAGTEHYRQAVTEHQPRRVTLKARGKPVPATLTKARRRSQASAVFFRAGAF